jgi:hypothetical protein
MCRVCMTDSFPPTPDAESLPLCRMVVELACVCVCSVSSRAGDEHVPRGLLLLLLLQQQQQQAAAAGQQQQDLLTAADRASACRGRTPSACHDGIGEENLGGFRTPRSALRRKLLSDRWNNPLNILLQAWPLADSLLYHIPSLLRSLCIAM